jgi:Tfp pilus assembly protein PilO
VTALPTRGTAWLGGAVLALLALDWVWIAGPRWTALDAARARVATRRLELDAARREAAARGDTRRAVRATARALARAEARLPDRREVSGLLEAVAAAARDAHLTVLALRPKSERVAPDHVAVPVELEMRGTWAETTAFLRGLESLGRLVHVGALRLERPRRLADRLVVDGHATLLTYRLPDRGDRHAAPATREADGDR